MKFLSLGMVAVLLALTMPAASAQSPSEPQPPATFDAAAIRKQAAQLAEFRALLSDPNPDVRLLTMREAIRTGDVAQREIATDAGLASDDSAIIGVALDGLLTNVQQIVLEFLDKDGKLATTGRTSIVLHVTKFDSNIGKISGTCNAPGANEWSGQIRGSAFSFSTPNGVWSGTLLWSRDTSSFRGRINIDSGAQNGLANVVWKVR